MTADALLPSARRTPRPKPHRMAVLVLAGVSAIDLGVPVQVFGAESNSVGQVPGTATTAGGWPYSVTVCGVEPGTVTGADGLSFAVDHGLEALAEADTILIPGASSAVAGEAPAAVIGGLLTAFERGARIAALSTGTFVLARTGLLDGRRATTHWSTAQALARRYPTIDVDENVLFIDEGQLLTSAGAASAIDLCLHLIRRDHGVGLSNQVARRLVAAAYRSAGQAQYVPRSVPEPLGDVFADTRQWALQHIGEELTLAACGQRGGVGADVLAPVRRGHRVHADAVGAARPRRPGPGAPGEHRSGDRADRRPGGARHRGEPADALPAHPLDLPERVPAHVLGLRHSFSW